MAKKTITLTVFFFLYLFTYAGEGMWIPSLLQHFNIDDMHEEGFRLSAEDIYSINNSSIKDAVVIFGGGCTGELISEEGLLITNHHCGYRAIQSHSSVEHNYLKDGFWAEDKSQELANPDLTATFLVRIEDVTDQVLGEIDENMTEEERRSAIEKITEKIEEEAVEGTDHEAVTKAFYYGNEFYMFIYKTYNDVRLAGAPPSSIGKFGGDTDNWMWPRHTGDFSLFRIYADTDNQPAEYSEDNVPYKPKKSLPVSLNGFEKDDFTMVMGYPGSTQQYLTSHGVKLIAETRNPNRIELRDIKLEVMEKYMEQDEAIKIKYAAKQSGVSNAWKKWQGEIRGLERYNAVEKKQELEKQFTDWAQSKPEYEDKYAGLIKQFEKTYNAYHPYALSRDYFIETSYYGIELLRFASNFGNLLGLEEGDEMQKQIDDMRSSSKSFFKDYVTDIDKEICPQLLEAYHENIDERFYPSFFNKVEEEFDNDFNEYTEYLYQNTIFTDSTEVYSFLDDFIPEDSSKILNDPAFRMAQSFGQLYEKEIVPDYRNYNIQLDSLYRIYVDALRTMKENENFWPDANFTMRVAYGKVEGYEPRDAVVYHYQTTLDGVIEKNKQGKKDYEIPGKLKKLYENKDYGNYAMDNGKLPVCFIASNHTSGGNSGSPVLNANGELIGVNFDRNWEGTMSDIMYDPDQCRNITLDIRYALFIIDKFAGASHLIEEMNIVE
ncbi:MAG: S46 family peptidase [Bacteroidales bacterium]